MLVEDNKKKLAFFSSLLGQKGLLVAKHILVILAFSKKRWSECIKGSLEGQLLIIAFLARRKREKRERKSLLGKERTITLSCHYLCMVVPGTLVGCCYERADFLLAQGDSTVVSALSPTLHINPDPPSCAKGNLLTQRAACIA